MSGVGVVKNGDAYAHLHKDEKNAYPGQEVELLDGHKKGRGGLLPDPWRAFSSSSGVGRAAARGSGHTLEAGETAAFEALRQWRMQAAERKGLLATSSPLTHLFRHGAAQAMQLRDDLELVLEPLLGAS